MGRTPEASQKAKATLLAKDANYYKKLSALGGKHSNNRPFRDKEIAKRAGQTSQARRKKVLDKTKHDSNNR